MMHCELENVHVFGIFVRLYIFNPYHNLLYLVGITSVLSVMFQVFRKVGGALEDRVIKWFDYLWQNKVTLGTL